MKIISKILCSFFLFIFIWPLLTKFFPAYGGSIYCQTKATPNGVNLELHNAEPNHVVRLSIFKKNIFEGGSQEKTTDNLGYAVFNIPNTVFEKLGEGVYHYEVQDLSTTLNKFVCGKNSMAPSDIIGSYSNGKFSLAFETNIIVPTCCNINTNAKILCEDPSNSSIRGIQTSLGCFPTNPQAIISWFLKYAIYLAGGIGFLLMLFASIQMMTSQGDPEKLKNAKGMFSSAIIGMLMVIFSLYILKFIGATLLKIPGWS